MMNATERARRSDALYFDTKVTNRRALCDMVANLESDLEESKAEADRLRKLASDMRWCLNDKCSWCQKFGTSCSTERDRQKLGIEADR